MGTLSIIFIALLTGLLIYTVSRLSFGLYQNYQQGQQQHRQLVSRLHLLPIAKLLTKLGINHEEYILSRPVNDIEKQIRNCEQCAESTNCSKKLTEKGSNQTEQILGFCPNTLNFFEYHFEKRNEKAE